jgi:hypothetical protein
MAVRGRTWLLLAAVGASIALGIVGFGCGERSTDQDLRDIEKSYYALRDAILQGDDEAFFAMHSEEARRWAVSIFPSIRAGYLAANAAERERFEKKNHVTAKEFLDADPRAMVVRMMPLKSGWRDRREMFRSARVKDVRIDRVPLPDGSMERQGIVVLEPPVPSGGGAPEEALPAVVFIREKDGWRRQAFFMEEHGGVGSPGRR